MPVSRSLIGLLVGLWGVTLTGKANAALLFCNHTKAPIEAAIGYLDKEWQSEGWWQIKPGLCVRALSQPLSKHFYFYYARALAPIEDDKTPPVWQGKYAFCIKDTAFHFKGDGGCDKKGARKQGFHEIDIGAHVRDYTLDFKG